MDEAYFITVNTVNRVIIYKKCVQFICVLSGALACGIGVVQRVACEIPINKGICAGNQHVGGGG